MGYLREYQAEAAAFALKSIRRCGGAGLFLDMGLGKTLTSIAVMDVLHAADPDMRFLVVAPSLVARKSWPDELDKWRGMHSLDWTALAGRPPARRRELLEEDTAVTIVSQDLLAWLDRTVEVWPWRGLVVDELSGYRNPDSVRFRVLRARRANRAAHPLKGNRRSRAKGGPVEAVLGLTGTPATRNLLDLWAEMYLVDGGRALGDTMSGYRDRWFHPTRFVSTGGAMPRAVDWEADDGARPRIMAAVAPEALSMRARDRLPGLPDMLAVDHWVDMPAATRRRYDELRRDMVAELGDREVTAANAGVLTGKLCQLTAGCLYPDADDPDGRVARLDDAKLDELERIVDGADGPVLVFYRFKDELERLRARFDGLREVHEPGVLDEWNAGRVPLLAAHPASAKFGLNIQHGGHEIVWLSLTWSLDEYDQANARLHRSGQERAVRVHRILEEGTVDERMVDVLERRRSLHDAVMGALEGD